MKVDRTLPINVTIEMFFIAFLEVLEPKLRLRKRDRSVLAELMYQCHLRKDLPKEDRFALAFGYEGRQVLQEKLDISSYVLSNSLLQLRKKGFVNGNTLPDYLLIDPGEELNLTFNFKIENEEENEL